MKQYFLMMMMMMTVILSLVSPAQAAVDPTSQVQGGLKTINRVDHNDHYLVIDDEIFYLRLNTKVYKYNSSTGVSRLMNRYALKSGQSVFLGVSGTHRKAYVDVLLIPE
ncbi:MAG: hypothetical protein ACI9D5_000262 [Candidatus Endobugula sp.]|jgi:hypothetical protein